MPLISLISFGYVDVDFVVGEWISWISLLKQTGVAPALDCNSDVRVTILGTR